MRRVVVILLRLLLAGFIVLLGLAINDLYADDSPGNVFARPFATAALVGVGLVALGLFALVPAIVGLFAGKPKA